MVAVKEYTGYNAYTHCASVVARQKQCYNAVVASATLCVRRCSTAVRWQANERTSAARAAVGNHNSTCAIRNRVTSSYKRMAEEEIRSRGTGGRRSLTPGIRKAKMKNKNVTWTVGRGNATSLSRRCASTEMARRQRWRCRG